MPFGLGSIDNIAKRILPIAGPALGSALGGPIGGTIAGAIFAPPPPSPTFAPQQPAPLPVASFGNFPQTAPQTGTVRRTLPTQTTVVGMGALPAVARGVTRVGQIVARSSQALGRRVTSNEIVAAAIACGIDLAAQTFFLDETEVCELIVAKRKRRRARGISAADLRRTRATIRKVSTIRKQIRALSR